jgi:transcriptional regulator GlxA family with amidase domain
VRAEAEAAAAEAAAEAERAWAEAGEAKAELEAELARRRRRSATVDSRAPGKKHDRVPGAPDLVPRVPRVGPATVQAVLDARRAEPSATQKEIAARVQVSDRTVRAVFAAVGNGRTVGGNAAGGSSAA